ncbi:MAG: YidC/Oxa1 family membrane protein insertase [Eubacteriales bacterium]|nr:YidC/Oxa1 family membrane protein insertase [Eubacteriales bacterium]
MTDFLTSILNWIQSFVGNYGWSIVLFTVLIRVVLLPLDYKNRKGMRKMQKFQPELNKLQQKYANDKAKLQQKQAELMKREKYNPMSGCLPLLIQMPILFAMFAAMRQIANEQTVRQVFEYLQGNTPEFEGWLWVRNIWTTDSPFSAAAPSVDSLRIITFDVWQKVYSTLSAGAQADIISNISSAVESFQGTFDLSTAEAFKTSLPLIQETLIQMPNYQSALATVPGWSNLNFFITTLSIFRQYNGLMILPILAGVSQVFMTKMNPATAAPAQQGANNPAGGGFMKYFFPIFSVYICLSSNAGFALYWVVANVFATLSGMLLSAYLEKKDGETVQLNEVK